ncbi:MAG: RDD family protein [Nocardioidaceae bacterium]
MTDEGLAQDYPGGRRGLPEDGPGSVAGWGRRVAALVVDWVLSLLVVGAFVGPEVWSGGGVVQWAPLAVFAAEVWTFTSLLGASAGQLLLGLVIRRTTGARLDPGRALLRTILICLVIPPLVFNRDQQGLHDLAVDSIALKSR